MCRGYILNKMPYFMDLNVYNFNTVEDNAF